MQQIRVPYISSRKVGINLYKQLDFYNISVADVAEMLDIDISTVYRWLDGSRLPQLKYLVALANYFDVSVEELLQ